MGNLSIPFFSGKHRYSNFEFQKIDIYNREDIANLFQSNQFDYVIHLAAQAGVRFSLDNPFAYSDSNLSGFLKFFTVYGPYGRPDIATWLTLSWLMLLSMTVQSMFTIMARCSVTLPKLMML